MQIRSILATKESGVITAQKGDPVRAVVRTLSSNNIGAVVVLGEGRRVMGIFSERDLLHGLAEHGDAALDMQVGELMNDKLYICRPTDKVTDALNWITRYRVRHLPVIEENQLHGIVSIGDLVKKRLEEVTTEANVLRDIVTAR